MEIRIWHVKTHNKSEQAYRVIERICRKRQDFTEFGSDTMLYIAWLNATPELYSRVDKEMKKIAIADLTGNQQVLAALEEDKRRWEKTKEKVKEFLNSPDNQ